MILLLGVLLFCRVLALPLDEVDPFYGTEGPGHVFPGATRPFGMVKMGIDVIGASMGDAYSGFAPDGDVVAISMMHESGTGGLPQYGVVAQLPVLGPVDYRQQTRLLRYAPDIASPGYFKTHLANGVTLELAAANRSGIYRYQFPQGQTPQIIVQGSLHLVAPERPWWTQYFDSGELEYENDRYMGRTTISGGWGEPLPWTIYYCGEFDIKPTKVNAFSAGVTNQGTKVFSEMLDDYMGLSFEFPHGTTLLKSKVGVSFISAKRACRNIDKDFGTDYNFDQIKKDSELMWNEEVFDKVRISTNNKTISSLIYTSLYGAHLLPSDRTGENPVWASLEPYYDDWFTIWDTYRCLNPLYNIINPRRATELIRSLIDIYRYDGFYPEGRALNQNGRTQGGSNAEIVIADAYIKGIDDGMISWEELYMGMVNDAEIALPYVYDSYSPKASTKEGRGGVEEWVQYGFVTRNHTRCLTRTMEYSFDDFAISVLAEGLGKHKDLEKFKKRAAGWQNVWNFEATAESLDYKGFIQPRKANGEFDDFDYTPLTCGNCYWQNDIYEGTPIEYGWSVPHDVETLKKFIGTDDLFVKRLDDMFGLYGKLIADIGNEPSFLTPYLYNFVRKQYRTVETIRYLVDNYYGTGPLGLSGNSDAGSMQLWLFWALIGMYPIAGTTTYLLSSPFMPYIQIDTGNGHRLEITANGDFKKQIYVQNVTLNGMAWNQSWVSHSDVFQQNSWLHFELGETPVVWETGKLPPSPGHYELRSDFNYTTSSF